MPTQPPLGTLTNFTAALRKPMLINSYYFSPSDATSWIASLTTGGGNAGTQTTFVQSPDNSRTSFTPTIAFTSGIFVYLNGVYQYPTTSYTLVGANVVFNTAPQVGDLLACIVF